MKRVLKTTPGILSILMLAITMMATSSSFAAAKPSTTAKGTVVSVSGGAVVVDEGGKSTPIKKGTIIREGHTIRTDTKGTITIDLDANGEALSVRPASELKFEALRSSSRGGQKVTDTKIDLRKGSILGNVKKLASASKYEVKTAKGVAGIRGTSFEISAVGIVRVATGELVFVTIPLTGGGPVKTFTIAAGSKLNAGGQTPQVQPMSPGELQQVLTDANGAAELVGIAFVVAGSPQEAAKKASDLLVALENNQTDKDQTSADDDMRNMSDNDPKRAPSGIYINLN